MFTWNVHIHTDTENVCNVHTHMHRNPKNMKHLWLSWSRYETFIYLFEFKVFRHEERETQFLPMLTFPSDPTTCGTPPQTTGLASASSENRLPSSSVESQLTVFFKFQSPQHIASRPDGIHVPSLIFYLGFLLWHLWLSYPPRAREHLHSMCAPN